MVKFDLRLYAVLTSADPARLYLHSNGIVRLASRQFSSDPATLADKAG